MNAEPLTDHITQMQTLLERASLLLEGAADIVRGSAPAAACQAIESAKKNLLELCDINGASPPHETYRLYSVLCVAEHLLRKGIEISGGGVTDNPLADLLELAAEQAGRSEWGGGLFGQLTDEAIAGLQAGGAA